ncbi:hypothetical protein L1049_004940 [Liquidambar formosana]|uniref:MORF/ORRM1/DAG-like MORF domain-containing protein n=1 Tax=Liquidambar formosana TaxID=63359 RepID=A0AAP0RNZ6_LIQFO
MIRTIVRQPLKLTAALSHSTSVSNVQLHRRYRSLIPPFRSNLSPVPFSSSSSASGWFSNDSSTGESAATQRPELTRVPSLLEGCDYVHWLVVMEPPRGYPHRDQIVHEYIKTLAVALGSLAQCEMGSTRFVSSAVVTMELDFNLLDVLVGICILEISDMAVNKNSKIRTLEWEEAIPLTTPDQMHMAYVLCLNRQKLMEWASTGTRILASEGVGATAQDGATSREDIPLVDGAQKMVGERATSVLIDL